jgi:hypothetical protein
LPLIERERRFVRLLGKAKWRSIRFAEHPTDDGNHVCRVGWRGIVSKRTDSRTHSALTGIIG